MMKEKDEGEYYLEEEEGRWGRLEALMLEEEKRDADELDVPGIFVLTSCCERFYDDLYWKPLICLLLYPFFCATVYLLEDLEHCCLAYDEACFWGSLDAFELLPEFEMWCLLMKLLSSPWIASFFFFLRGYVLVCVLDAIWFDLVPPMMNLQFWGARICCLYAWDVVGYAFLFCLWRSSLLRLGVWIFYMLVSQKWWGLSLDMTGCWYGEVLILFIRFVCFWRLRQDVLFWCLMLFYLTRLEVGVDGNLAWFETLLCFMALVWWQTVT